VKRKPRNQKRHEIASLPDFELSYGMAKPVLMAREFRELAILVVGLGGTGSWVAPHVARLTAVMSGTDHYPKIQLYFVDFDVVENTNLVRQNFTYAEVGRNKAQTLALRYSMACGIEIKAVLKPFKWEMVQGIGHNTQVILMGCVDNALARQELNKCLMHNDLHTAPKIFWIDAGNGETDGQVLIGTDSDHYKLREAFKLGEVCTRLPSPLVQHPELAEPKPEELAQPNLSCEELAIKKAQSLTINQRMAAVMSDYLLQLLNGSLRKLATYLDLPTGTEYSYYTTLTQVARILGVEAKEFFGLNLKR
jgi:PRTRC genetic system ThiF family protein